MKKTKWFPADVKPVHVGVYEVQNMYGSDLPNLFNYWTGKRWTGAMERICDLIMSPSPMNFAVQDRVWRGLTEAAREEDARQIEQSNREAA
jgi:hypothetical protein